MDECRTEEAPLTLGQERLWFLDRLDPGDPAYNIYLAHRLRGALDIEALQRAYDGVIARHGPLRTRYRTVDGVPVQQAMPARPLAIELLDLGRSPEERVREALNERAVAPFDLENGSVVRACLARLGQDEHVLLTVLHHIAGDGAALAEVRPVLELVAAQESNAGMLLRAEQIAEGLREAGVKAGNLVALELERGPEVIPAMLAAWRLGAGYVPIDPDQPVARRERMLADAGVAAVVKGPKDIFAVAGGKRFDDPAYAIFTSGSSGVPKPVLVGREALAARVAWMVPAYELRPGDRVVQFAALGFDTHAEEIWPALCAGASVVMLPDGPQSLPEVLAADPGISVLDLPTARIRART